MDAWLGIEWLLHSYFFIFVYWHSMQISFSLFCVRDLLLYNRVIIINQ